MVILLGPVTGDHWMFPSPKAFNCVPLPAQMATSAPVVTSGWLTVTRIVSLVVHPLVVTWTT